MFVNDTLKEHIETSSTIRLNSAVIAEWNMNIAENIFKLGNYRYRPLDPENTQYNLIAQSFSTQDNFNNFYTGATDADIVVDGGVDDEDNPLAFLSKKQKEKLLYSLEDCFGRFRPRSGINKLRYFDNKFSHFANPDMASRPRYYIASKRDTFKYWTSYRTEDGIERGVANQVFNNQNHIEDACPFVVYKEPVPANRIVLKLQTHVGSVDFGQFQNNGKNIPDPFYGSENAAVPSKFSIQYLDDTNSWITAATFNETSTRADGSPIFSSDGYLELFYGLQVEDKYADNFALAGTLLSTSLLPDANGMPNGTAYLVTSDNSAGTLYIVENNDYINVPARYGWKLDTEDIASSTNFVSDLTSPASFVNSSDGKTYYREISYIHGLRLVVETMNVFDATLDLIELSPRLTVDISDKVTQFSLSKNASDLGVSGMPVGQLLASTGSLELFDYDQAFLDTNPNSIIRGYLSQNIQFKFYEIINIPHNGYYYVPIKTLYSEDFPSINNSDRTATLQLRDLFFYFESETAPQILIQNASVSSAVSMLLDSAGFSNYVFKRNENEAEDIIPNFFVEPDMSLAEVLNQIAVSTQSAMFFDEYNNFVMMSKNYILPLESERPTDLTLYGSKDYEKSGLLKNESTKTNLANIIDISQQDNKIFNGGSINYVTRSIQRSYSTIRQASLLDKDKTWVYKPALLWEVTGDQNTKSINEEVGTQTEYSLAAMPLNSDLSDELPYVLNGSIVSNAIDFGDAVYWLSRYSGYFFANGEIIKYDAVQYNIPGLSNQERLEFGIDSDNVWISSTQEYQKYFAKIPFNGKMYPTGLVRIYAEPNYTEIPGGKIVPTDGAVAKHGRCQFGTGRKDENGNRVPVYHNAGLSEYWTSNEHLRGCYMNAKDIFQDAPTSIVIENVELVTNDPKATFSVEEASSLRVGSFVRKAQIPGRISLAVLRNEIPNRTTIESIDLENNTITLSAPVTYFNVPEGETLTLDLEFFTDIPDTVIGPAGIERTVQQSSIRTGLIKNMLANRFIEEITYNIPQPGTVQSSAFVFKGNINSSTQRKNNYVAYVYKKLDEKFRHFGTRMRIVGKIENDSYRGQSPEGSSVYYNLKNIETGDSPSIAGSSGGMAVMINPETNNGYYFEIASLTNVGSDSEEMPLYNMVFYKIMRNANAAGDDDVAIPVRLWAGSGNILVDDGRFVGQGRMTAEENPTVYDLSVEYENFESGRRFYLYVNNVPVGIVTDPDPLPVYNNMALFVRGNAKCMFENIYALTDNYSQNTTFAIEAPVHAAFGIEELTARNSFQKYAISGAIQSTYLSGISTEQSPKYDIYFEEFGTIMREASYFNVRYDKAYPALLAQISPTFNRVKGFTVSGFIAGAYGAEFLVFNNTDTVLNLDSTSGNYLRIQGVTFTQESVHELSVDDFFQKASNFDETLFDISSTIESPLIAKQQYQDIKFSRITQGQKYFTIEAPYLQTQDAAENMMLWLTGKIMKSRKSVGLSIFANPMIQLGDIVKIDYTNSENYNEISDSRFVVYSIEYQRSVQGPEMKVFLSEVTS